ncbi:DUF1002 domain-containing protein [Anaeromicropila populeti]|uniref:Uncharacterized protein YpuA, DUF1002 family n=1 Tax=Anaeromicropila populeti TaxID=37658 RepID=A0A1I6JQD0_9FIRM|nr:DUF1002 domain-containing protein [Anaeromicropila populeti]SFR81192.1 Uncharacterized protein YpuA, DUF1002 family [Anaeromicropila populeti]
MRLKKILLSFVLLGAVLIQQEIVSADSYDESVTPYVALGADLTEEQKNTVFNLLDIEEEDLEQYKVVEVTNQEEYEYLSGYLSSDIIGTKALSSVKVIKMEDGEGITVRSYNINYCTNGMYCNALLTAGISDAEVVVAGPFQLTGTAALVGTIKAYEEMTGKEIPQESIDAAMNELVLTGELAEDIGNAEKMEQLIALVKQAVVEKSLDSREKILEEIQKDSATLDLELTENQKEKIADLMGKIEGLNLNIDTMKQQAKELYDKLAELNLDTEGFFAKIGNWFSNLWDRIAGLFS